MGGSRSLEHEEEANMKARIILNDLWDVFDAKSVSWVRHRKVWEPLFTFPCTKRTLDDDAPLYTT